MTVCRATISFVDRRGEERVQSVRLELHDDRNEPWTATFTDRLRFRVESEPLHVSISGRYAQAHPTHDEEGVVVGLRGITPFSTHRGNAAAG